MIPAVALRGLTILPDMIIHFDLSRQKSIFAVEKAMMGDQRLFLVTQKDPNEKEPDISSVYTVGTVSVVKQITKLPNGIVRVLVEGSFRAELVAFAEQEEEFLLAEVNRLFTENDLNDNEEEAMLRELKELFKAYGTYHPKIGKTLERHFAEMSGLEECVNQLTANLPLLYENKQKVLAENDLRQRFETLALILGNEIEIAKVKSEVSEKIKGRVEKHQKEYLLREQLGYIRQELGEKDEISEAEQFEEALKKLKAGKEVKEKIAKEIARFKNLSVSSSESAVERGYIETLLDLPWEKASKDNLDITYAEKILEEQHYGLEQVKQRVLEFLAVRTLNKNGASPIICLVGPPGTGKTSIARSVAEALNKKYVRICLGGVRDEAEIRGHRKTYVGAMPGRIVTGLRQAGVKNPLMLLDEIDKVSSDHKGDTSSALLEVLDSEQNNKFRDHYVELPVDLSEVLFIATANSTSTIPKPLLDRMEVIEVNSYTANEKFHIASRYLVKKQLEKNGLTKEQLSVSDGALKKIIEYYVREAGVRGLERKIGEICRKAAWEIVKTGKKDMTIRVTGTNLTKYLGKEKYSLKKANEADEVGIVRGLAWTSVGGDTLQIEVNMMPGKGDVELTGQLGDVMKESAMAGMSYVRSVSEEYKLETEIFKKHDFHIHIPEGAVPKDGPSAGITMATALLSVVTGIPVRADVAMTGEITLRGRVLPIGGLKEKMLAAKTAGIKTVLVPKENEKDVDEISKEIKAGMEIIPVETMKEVLEHALVKKGKGKN
ncbi:MAG: endopeptidase La [Lachnospiraceae bacterium]|nr:endopeptidase La [Lachnospiraceae bacterium]